MKSLTVLEQGKKFFEGLLPKKKEAAQPSSVSPLVNDSDLGAKCNTLLELQEALAATEDPSEQAGIFSRMTEVLKDMELPLTVDVVDPPPSMEDPLERE